MTNDFDAMVAKENMELGATKFLKHLLDRLEDIYYFHHIQTIRLAGIQVLSSGSIHRKS